MSSLTSYFPEQFEQLRSFMISPIEVVRCIRIDEEMKGMLINAFAKMEDDPTFPHAFIHVTESFKNPIQYFEKLLAILSEQCSKYSEELNEKSIFIDNSFQSNTSIKIPHKFVNYAQNLTKNFPEHIGSLVFILDPEGVTDIPEFQQSIRFLYEQTKDQWLKFLVFDPRVEPRIEIPDSKDNRIGFQTFHLSPDEIQRRIKDDLASPDSLQPLEKRQYLGMLAGFAFANKNYDEAEKLQKQWVNESANGEPSEKAAALYNLGNTLLAKGSFTEAIDVFCEACNLCIDKNIVGFTPMVYTNLGVCLHRQGDFVNAFAALKVARDTFKAQKYLPGEAHVVETLAQMYADDGQNDKAEQSWRYALSLYDNITSTTFQDLREMGRSNVLDKLKRFFDATGQEEKLKSLEDLEGATHA